MSAQEFREGRDAANHLFGHALALERRGSAGDAPWDIQVYDASVYRMILAHGTLGFGEAYVNGLWECVRLDELFERLLSIDADERLGGWARLRLLGEIRRHGLLNLQSSRRAFQVAAQHYDIGNDVFEAMLDPAMRYSCGTGRGRTICRRRNATSST